MIGTTSDARATDRVEEVLAAKRRFLVPCVYHFYRTPPVIVRAEGVWLYDHTGRRYLDGYSGVGVMNAGHGNPHIIEPAIEQIRTLQHTTTLYLTEPIVELARRLAQIAPSGLTQSFFCASGSEANEAALLMACLATGRRHIIALEGALHGRTKWAMSATGLPLWRTDPHLLETVHHAPRPTDPEALDRLEALIRRIGPAQVAAVIAEPIQGNGGIVVPPAGYWPRLREICNAHGMLLIADEVQTGFNRTGRWFALDHWGVEPDLMTVSKALGNGFPIAAAIVRPAVADAYRRPGASTAGGNPVACRAALATLDFHQQADLGARASRLGDRLKTGLEALARRHEAIAEVRGLGLMLGAELRDRPNRPAGQLADDVLESMKEAGFLIGKTGPGRNVLTFMPPLVIEAGDIDRLLEALDETLARVAD